MSTMIPAKDILPKIRTLYRKVKNKKGRLSSIRIEDFAYICTVETDDLHYYETEPITWGDMDNYLETGDKETEQKIIEVLENATFKI